jgi:hypothetical protein
METPEAPPPPDDSLPEPERPKLGLRFAFAFFLPLLVMAIVFPVMREFPKADGLMTIPAIACFICGIRCAALLGYWSASRPVGRIMVGLFTFGLIELLYVVIFVAGCSAAVPANFK